MRIQSVAEKSFITSLLFLAGCAPVDGTWLFTRNLTLPTGDECTSGVTHDFIGAYEPATLVEDTAWTVTSDAEVSPDVFFGRIDQQGKDAVLIVGTEAFPGVQSDDGTWVFTWDHRESGADNETHESGYAYAYSYESTTTRRISGTVGPDGFVGRWEDESRTTQSWTESDTWSEEVAALVGTTGRVPAGSHLLRLDSTGVEVAASNDYLLTDCDASGCLLTVTQACGYAYDLIGDKTGFSADDGSWTEDAGQSSGL